MPRVTIILPTYNRPDLMPRALASVATQTFGDFEVVIVNDGGQWVEGRLHSICRRSVRVLHRENGGPAAARNTALAVSDSEYVAYLDDDDEWESNHLESLIALLTDNPESAVGFSIANVVDNGRHIRLWGDCRFDKFILDGFYTVFPLSVCLHRRDILLRSGQFDEHPLLVGPEDCEFMIRVSDFTTPVASRKVTARMHRDHSMTREPRKEWVDALAYVINKNGYGITRENWLMFYRAMVAAVHEGRDDLAMRWAEQLDRELPPNLRRSEHTITGEMELHPNGIKSYCRHVLEG